MLRRRMIYSDLHSSNAASFVSDLFESNVRILEAFDPAGGFHSSPEELLKLAGTCNENATRAQHTF